MRENTGLNQHIDIKAITQVKLDITFSSKLLRHVYGYYQLFIAQSINISQHNILDRPKGMMPFGQYLLSDNFHNLKYAMCPYVLFYLKHINNYSYSLGP
jgi:hypothetical protein